MARRFQNLIPVPPKQDNAELARELNIILRTVVYRNDEDQKQAAQRLMTNVVERQNHWLLLGKPAPRSPDAKAFVPKKRRPRRVLSQSHLDKLRENARKATNKRSEVARQRKALRTK